MLGKEELIRHVAERTGKTQKEARAYIEAALDAVADALGKGEEVRLAGFGTFRVKERSARTVLPPGAEEPVTVPPRKAVVFSAAKALKAAVAGEE